MSLVKLTLVVALLVGGTAAAVISYVDSLRPVPLDRVVLDLESPVSPGGVIELARPDPEGEELGFTAT